MSDATSPASAEDTQQEGLAPAEVYVGGARRRASRLSTPVWLALLVAAMLVGCYVGHYVLLDPINFGTLGGRTSLSETNLDETVATYTYQGETHEITARQALAHEASLDAMRASDGSYVMPSAESVLSVARTEVLMREVEGRGIEVSDEELAAYAHETFGTDDIAALANTYTMSEADVRDRLRESCGIARLRAEVVQVGVAEPVRPGTPEAGHEGEATSEYAAYVLGLAGDEWDAEQGTWASYEGPFASALRDYDVRSDAATYDAAQAAYEVAYQLHSASVNAAGTQWTEYVNKLLAGANLALSSIVS